MDRGAGQVPVIRVDGMCRGQGFGCSIGRSDATGPGKEPQHAIRLTGAEFGLRPKVFDIVVSVATSTVVMMEVVVVVALAVPGDEVTREGGLHQTVIVGESTLAHGERLGKERGVVLHESGQVVVAGDDGDFIVDLSSRGPVRGLYCVVRD